MEREKKGEMEVKLKIETGYEEGKDGGRDTTEIMQCRRKR